MEEKLSESAKVLDRLEETRIGKDVPVKDPTVSVIIPAFEISECIAETLDSVFAQTLQDFEVVVVNDGSKDTDLLEKNLEKYADRIIYGRQKNYGASLARNAAICLSRGKFIAFLDGDDLWLPNCLEKQIKTIEEKELDMIYCDAELFGDNFFNGQTYMETTPSNGEVNPISLIDTTCNVITSGTIVRRTILAEVNLFDSRSIRSQDFDLWFRIAKFGAKIGYQRDVLIKYRLSATSLSGSNVERAERNVTILEFIRNKYVLTAEENEVVRDQIEFSEAEVELEKGKYNLIRGNYSKAQGHFSKANAYYKKPKLLFLKLLLKVSPALTLKLFKKFRPAEYSFISPDQTQH